jgi:(p)ppGpp synthase/HD superfamily hydrolase
MKFSPLFEYALLYATRLHADQQRKGKTVPYISHLLGVAAIVIEQEGNEEEAIAALLHDAVEDQGGEPRLEEIRRVFGEKVAAIVAGCTDSWVIPKPPWRQRKEEYLERLPGQSHSVHLVSCADKLYNARNILDDYRQTGDETWRCFKGGKEGTLWYYRALVKKYQEIKGIPGADELDRVVTELERLAL